MRDATWIAGCERCRSHLLSVCADAGFDPRIGYSSDDMVVMQAWVAAGLGVATQTGLALRAHHIDGVVATELPDSKRHIYAATYGEPPDPPATAALLAALAEAATSAVTRLRPEPPRSRRETTSSINSLTRCTAGCRRPFGDPVRELDADVAQDLAEAVLGRYRSRLARRRRGRLRARRAARARGPPALRVAHARVSPCAP